VPTWLALALLALPELPLTAARNLGPERLEIQAGEGWSATLQVPASEGSQTPVLVCDAWVQTGGSGGCNWVMQLLLDGVPLSQRLSRPRLLNKLPGFQPPGTAFDFTWYRSRDGAWMTIFAPPGTNWGGTGQDTRFVFDLAGRAAPDTSLRLELRHGMPELPAAIKKAAAPLIVEHLRLAFAPTAAVAAQREAILAQSGVTISPAVAGVPAGERAGERPYELVWSQRPESPVPQVTFADLTGWQVVRQGDAEVSLTASVAQPLWRERTARLRYAGGASPTLAELLPPEPIVLGDVDAADLWLYGAFKRAADRPLRIQALLEDAVGREATIDLGGVLATYWGVQHGVLRREARGRLQPPLRLVGLALENLQVDGERDAWLASLAFYQERRKPETQLRRLDPPPFPTHPDGLLPTPPAGVRAGVRGAPDGAEFTSLADGVAVRYRVQPAAGCLHGVTVTVGEAEPFRPMAGGGLRQEGVQAGQPGEARLEGEVYRVPFAAGEQQWTAAYQLRGRTLVIDLAGQPVEGVDFGHVDWPRARAVEVPYLGFERRFRPSVAVGPGGFLSLFPDIHHADYSAVDGERVGEAPALLAGTIYLPLTDGRRRPLRERLLLTVSPHFAEVLPTPPNPRSPNLERLAPCMFFMFSPLRAGLLETVHRHGVEQLLPTDFTYIVTSSFYEGFAGRARPHPSVPVAAVQARRSDVHRLGYGFGFYLDTRDFFPLNFAWDPNRISLTSEGDWHDGWYGNYLIKPTSILGVTREVGRRVDELYPPDCVYLDTHTNIGHEAMDYEAGVEGAGTARATLYGNGDAIWEARRWFGSTISEGIYRWFYAGLCDMDYAQIHSPTPPAELPPLVDFDLLKLHPRQYGTMMGYGPTNYLGAEESNAVYADCGSPLRPPPATTGCSPRRWPMVIRRCWGIATSRPWRGSSRPRR